MSEEIKDSLSPYEVYSWMVSKYELKGLDKDIFAIILKSTKIYGYYFGNLSLITDLTGYSRQSIIPSLKKLVDLGLIERNKRSYKAVVGV